MTRWGSHRPDCLVCVLLKPWVGVLSFLGSGRLQKPEGRHTHLSTPERGTSPPLSYFSCSCAEEFARSLYDTEALESVIHGQKGKCCIFGNIPMPCLKESQTRLEAGALNEENGIVLHLS